MIRIFAKQDIRDVDDDGTPLRISKGDVATVGDNFGQFAIEMSWAEDVLTINEIERGERRPKERGKPTRRTRHVVQPRNQVSGSVSR